MVINVDMKRLRVIGIIIGLALFLSTSTVYAFNPFGGVNCTNVSGSAVCQDSSKKATNVVTGGNGVLTKVTNIIALVAGIAAVILIIVGSIRYVASGGNSDKVEEAKRTIIYSLIGIVIIVLAKLIVSLVIANG